METEKILIHIAACIINNTAIDPSVLQNADYDRLISLARHHSLGSVVAAGLYRAGVKDQRIITDVLNAVRRDTFFDRERERVIQQLEEKEIWYLPLKGIILKTCYPEPYLRQMADNDILIDPERADDVREIMTSLGYKVLTYESWHHDNYTKQPFYHFEMHRLLIGEETLHRRMMNYYADVKRLLKKDPDNKYGFHLSDEDFYIFMIAHEYKHYSSEGTGLRSLLDTYVFLKGKADQLDWKYISKEIRKLGIEEFEAENRHLAMKVFSEGNADGLQEEELTMLRYLLQAGTYGNKNNLVINQASELGMFRYVLRRVFLPMESIHRIYPFFYKHKILIPLLPIYRLIRLRENAADEIKTLRRHKNQEKE